MLEDLEIVRVDAAPVGPNAQQFMVRTRDGIDLATDVYLPAGTPAPAIIVRLPYDKNSRYVFFDRIAERFTARGYAMVVQDVRGKFRSGGATDAYRHEVADGYDTVDWVVGEDWCDGRVGTFGDSYYGFTQWAIVASEHPALKAIVPRVTSARLGEGGRGIGGFGEPVLWFEGAGYFARVWVDHASYEYEADVDRRPLGEAFERAFEQIGARSSAFDDRVPVEKAHDPYEGFRHPFSARPVPVLHCVGWFDNLVIPHMRDFTELAQNPAWAPMQYLSAGAHDHENYHLDLAPIDQADDHNIDDAALERMLDAYAGPALDFLDVFVMGTRDPESLPRVSWELGHVGMRTADRWPPANAESQVLYLGDLAAAAEGLGGRLSDQRPADGEGISWSYDTHNLIPSTVKNSFAFLFDFPDEAGLGTRDDVLVFNAPPASQPLDLAGPVELQATVVSDAPSTDVFAHLLDVAPDGSARRIVRGQVHVAGAQQPQKIHINLGHTGYRLRPGHAFRLHICSSDFPLFVPNSGTEENPWTTTTPRASRQTLSTSPSEPAHLSLSVLGEAS